MSDKYQNKYRTTSHRMPGWDYSGNGMYFITLVTQNRECNLGEIIPTTDGAAIELSDFGTIVNEQWLLSFEIRNELLLDEYIIMPNHLHAIIILDKNVGKTGLDESHGSHGSHVETHGRASLHHHQQQPSNQHPIRKPKSISSFAAEFKSAVNSKIDDYVDEHQLEILKYNRNNHFFQPNYHDHIIRNEAEYQRIKQYIINNPLKWYDDTFNPNNKNKR
jgi:REP element-mobilizing transposase RayT